MTYLVNIQFTAPHLVLSDWDKLFDCCSCKCLWQQKGDMMWCADPFLFRPAQYSCPYHRQVVVWRDDLWCSQSLSAVTTDLPQCGWLPQCFCIHTVSSAHFPQLNVQDDYSPGGLCLNMSVRRSTLWHCQTYNIWFLAGLQQSEDQPWRKVCDLLIESVIRWCSSTIGQSNVKAQNWLYIWHWSFGRPHAENWQILVPGWWIRAYLLSPVLVKS